MKKFILHIVYFSIALLAVLTVVDGAVTYLYHHKDTRKYSVWNDILHKDIDADVLIMGNSRAWCQYSTHIIDSILGVNSYNIGIDGSCFDRQKVRYDIYRHYQRRKPDYIIQNVEFFTLGKTNGYEREQFMPYLMYPYFRNRIQETESFSFAELYIPMYRYFVNNVYDDYTKFDDRLYKGYYAEDIAWEAPSIEAIQPYYAEVDSITLQTFRNYIAETKREGIHLILVSAPVYARAPQIVLNENEIFQLYVSLANQYDIPLLDYRNMSICGDTLYFHNVTHLNRKGAEIFSAQLAHDLDSLGLIKR